MKFPRLDAAMHLVRAALIVLLVVFVGMAGRAQAHPHAWIDVHSTVVFNNAGHIAAIEQQWRFDELYTAALIYGMTAGQGLGESPSREAILAQYTREVIDNLEPYGYFMRVRADDQVLRLARVTTYQGALEGKRFVLRFTAVLTTPVDPQSSQVEFAVYDPTYFIQMMHQETDHLQLTGAGASACQARLHAPSPTPAMFARALALDRGAPADDTLGEMFAQKVRLQCR